jgi:AmmeMemoRadiSam system protein A
MNLPELARHSIEHYLQTGQILETPSGLPPELHRPAGAFVSLHDATGSLRGCIGTTRPTTPSLATEIIANAVAAATLDDRFPPVVATELESLHLSVDVLGTASPEPDITQLDPKKFGLIVQAADGRTGLLLPDLEGVNSVEQQISICRDKAGISPDEPIETSKFQVHRFEEMH